MVEAQSCFTLIIATTIALSPKPVDEAPFQSTVPQHSHTGIAMTFRRPIPLSPAIRVSL